jgi:hypothetical protein
MSNRQKIESFAFQNFRDKDASEFVSRWLCCFYANESMVQTLSAQAAIFSGFNGNQFYSRHAQSLYHICAHSLMSYAEGVSLLSVKSDGSAGIMAMMQGIEPVVHAARLLGLDSGAVRTSLVSLVDLLSEEGRK